MNAAIARGADAEVLDGGTTQLQLLLDSTDTSGAVTAHRVRLTDGAAGAPPHRHARTSEVFFVLDGRVDVLVGTEVVQATAGDLIVAPPGVPHAFGAADGHDGELLVLVTPGVERFEFYRQIVRIGMGEASPSSLAGLDDRYDNFAVASAEWADARR